MIPVVAVYSTFLQRAYDMLLHDVALMKLHVVLAVDHTGLVGADGETHHGAFDVGFLRQIPGMTVFCPANFAELRAMLRKAVWETSGPVAIRYPTGSEGRYTACTDAPLLREGTDCTLVTYGTLVNAALGAAELCEKRGISVEIVKLPRIAPLDMQPVLESVKKTGRILAAEETEDMGCVAADIFAALEEGGIRAVCARANLGCGFQPHGSIPELLHRAGLDAEGLLQKILEVVEREK